LWLVKSEFKIRLMNKNLLIAGMDKANMKNENEVEGGRKWG
jgi:hypothetical protein